jgi:hypothetical protein
MLADDPMNLIRVMPAEGLLAQDSKLRSATVALSWSAAIPSP